MRERTAFYLAIMTGALVVVMAVGFALLQTREKPEGSASVSIGRDAQLASARTTAAGSLP
jgi:preprotein translocase subunit SecG